MKSFSMILILTTLAIPTFARLNETKEQCNHRYGSVVSSEGDWVTYQMGPYRISVHFGVRNKVADTLMIQRMHMNQPVQLHVDEIKAILNANKRGGNFWTESDDSIQASDWRIEQKQTANEFHQIYGWLLSGGSGTATYDTEAKLLLISSMPRHPFPSEISQF